MLLIISSHVQAFPFDPNPDWSRFYSSGAEIQQYILRTASKWNLDRDVKLDHWVREARWLEERGQWRVTVEHAGHRRDEYADVLLSGQGVLVHYKWPTIEGLHDFRGHITHSANWDHKFDYSNTRVAVIGNGSSGIQIVPQLQKKCKEVTNFLRGPTWVYYRVPPSKHLGRETDDPNPAYTEDEKKLWREQPAKLRQMRSEMVGRTNKAFRMVWLRPLPDGHADRGDSSLKTVTVTEKLLPLQRNKWRRSLTTIQSSAIF
jgi:cation diffusion facilitator CzcD-associated flavoprotein CzcO